MKRFLLGSLVAFDGTWEVRFTGANSDMARNAGLFRPANDVVTGFILTNSGYRRILRSMAGGV
jgi:hypothetical protein